MPLVPDPWDATTVIIDSGVRQDGVLLDSPVLEGVHRRSECEPHACAIHQPSAHPLRDAPLRWRDDILIMERVCHHQLAHPDVDAMSFRERIGRPYDGRHACDGCCEWGPTVY